MVVKVQLPLNNPDALPAVYGNGYLHLVQQPVDDATKVAMGGDVKGFFEADFDFATDRWVIGGRVEDRSW